jgi:hypothetical protein
MEWNDFFGLLFILVLFPALWLIMRSNTAAGRSMRSLARGERRAQREGLSGGDVREWLRRIMGP